MEGESLVLVGGVLTALEVIGSVDFGLAPLGLFGLGFVFVALEAYDKYRAKK